MSSKKNNKKTPKNKKEDPLFQAVTLITQTKKKTPKQKTPKQKGGQDDFLNKIQDMLFTMNHVDYNGIGIQTTITPLNGNKDNIEKTFTEITEKEVRSTKPIRKCKQSTEKNIEEKKGGYGKKYINNHIRLIEDNQEDNLLHTL
jgi:hypothetical protein